MKGQWVWANVEFVESYTLKGKFGDVTNDSNGICIGDSDLVIPKNEKCADVIDQAASFVGEHDDYNEESRNHDYNELESLMIRSRCTSKAEMLKCALEALPKDIYQELKNSNFELGFDEEGKLAVNEAA